MLVIGCGGLGLNLIQLLLDLGAMVYVHDKRQMSLDKAMEFSVPKENTIPTDADLAAFVTEKGLLIDVVIDLVGTKETLTASQTVGEFDPKRRPSKCTRFDALLVRRAGRIVAVGAFGGDDELPFLNVLNLMKKTTILCHFGGTTDDLRRVLELMAKKKLKTVVEEKSFDDFAAGRSERRQVPRGELHLFPLHSN